MADYDPLFSEETTRTLDFRKIIIRKTIQISRRHPNLPMEDLVALVEQETVKACDLCVESSYDDSNPYLPGRYFVRDKREERHDHVGRFFLNQIQKKLRYGGLKPCLTPVFARSVGWLLGQDAYDKFSRRLVKLLEQGYDEGLTYEEVLDAGPAGEIMDEILIHYGREMSRSVGFEYRLKNYLDAALVKYYTGHKEEAIHIERTVQEAYDDFIRLMGL